MYTSEAFLLFTRIRSALAVVEKIAEGKVIIKYSFFMSK